MFNSSCIGAEVACQFGPIVECGASMSQKGIPSTRGIHPELWCNKLLVAIIKSCVREVFI